MKEIQWEKNLANGCAFLCCTKNAKTTPAKARQIAIQKMTDVSLVSAEFDGVRKVFETRFWVLTSTEKTTSFYGLYLPVFEDDADNKAPIMCIRFGFFENIKKPYNNTINSLWGQGDMYEKIIYEYENICDYAANGVKLKKTAEQEEKEWKTIRIFISNPCLQLDIEYYPETLSDAIFENMIKNILHHFKLAEIENGVVPDGNTHRVSYMKSLSDLIAI